MKWETIKLGDAATFVNGYAFKPSDWTKEGKEIIRIQNLTKSSGEINRFNGSIPQKYLVKKGDLLISWSATLGVYEWLGTDSWLNQHIFKVDFNKREIDKRFFRYLIESKLHELERQVHGATMKHITKSKFDNILIPLPPLPVQKQIADTLDKADALCRKDRKLLQKYDELAQSIFYEMFGDPIQYSKNAVALGELVIINPPKRGLQLKSEDEVSFIPMEAVGEDGYLKRKYVRKLGEVIKGFTYFEDGDVLFAKITPCMENGKGAIVSKLVNGIGFGSTEFHVIRPTQRLTNCFIHALIRLPTIRAEAEKQMTGSAGQKRVPKSFLENLSIIPPNYDQQIEFGRRLNIIEKARGNVMSSIEQSQKLFASLLQTNFS